MGDRVSEERGVVCDLARILTGGPLTADELLARACESLSNRYSLDAAAAFRFDGSVVRALAGPKPARGGGLEIRPADVPAQAEIVEEGGAALLLVPIVGRAGVLGVIAGTPGYEAEPIGDELRALTALGVALGAYVDQATALADLRRLDEAKGAFVSVASHELRTAVSVVHGVSATLHLRGDELAKQQVTDLRRLLYEQTTRLAELTEQLLDLSRIDAGAVRLRVERFSPRERFETMLPRLVPDRAADVDIEIDPDLELVTDPYVFERVASNLVVNALRYGSPPVTVRGLVEDDFRLEVEDRGTGVAAALVPQLFERFTRGEDEQRSGMAGAGLGLAIAWSFATALGGGLDYEPADPSGARFVFRLPVGDR